MRKYETVQYTGTREHLKEVICDLCGTSATNELGKPEGFDLIGNNDHFKTGIGYTDLEAGEEPGIDVCSDCFTSKLVPWVKQHNVKPEAKS